MNIQVQIVLHIEQFNESFTGAYGDERDILSYISLLEVPAKNIHIKISKNILE